MENKDKIRFKDLSVILQIAVVGGFMTAIYMTIIIVSFVLGMIVGIFIG